MTLERRRRRYLNMLAGDFQLSVQEQQPEMMKYVCAYGKESVLWLRAHPSHSTRRQFTAAIQSPPYFLQAGADN